MRRKKKTTENKVFDAVVYFLLIGLGLLTITPFLQVITISLSPQEELAKYGMHIFPRQITLAGYERVLSYAPIWLAYLNTIIRTVSGTTLSICTLLLGAYALSKPYFPHRRFWTLFIVFTMYFSGGLIPRYILVNNVLKMGNSMFALIIPGLASGFNLIIMRNFFSNISLSYEEAAKIDGASHFQILRQVYLPLSKPIIATVSLWVGVGHWNEWFDSMLYIRDEKKQVLQFVLRKLLLEGTSIEEEMAAGTQIFVNSDTMKMAALILSIIPVLMIYPFLQKHFVQGLKLGGVKE